MAVEYYRASEDIHERMRELIMDHHHDLVICNREIIVMFRDSAAKRGGERVMGTAHKVTAREKALAEEELVFMLVLAQDVWEELTYPQQTALLDHLLMHCRAKENPKTGKETFSIVPPDLMVFRENVERYGFWFPSLQSDGGMRFQVVKDDVQPSEDAAA
jgi:hypothetical protein